jgi:two-component system, OmpR family, sensor histidine kinase KdpD
MPAADDIGERAPQTSHFRVYLGVAAGSGKTIAMLDEGHCLRSRGADVVIAIAATHGRPVTRQRIGNLEVIPPRLVDYRGTRFEELDIDAVLRRQPQVALVDELAHTNVPGSGRHAKRWQDVLELLVAEIDVITTLNIQHLESIADIAEAITGVKVVERVPDWLVRQADQIELVDAPPESGNLAALREVARRFLAEETEGQLQRYLARYRTLAPWRTTEHIMAAVTPAPGADAIIRRAAQLAETTKADLDIVYVACGTGGPGRDHWLARLRQVTSDVGGAWHHLRDEDPATALIGFAREQRVTQIVLGASDRNGWRELTGGGSIVRRVSRLAARAGIDVHIVAARQRPRQPPT